MPDMTTRRVDRPDDRCNDPRHAAPCWPICGVCEDECDPEYREPTTDAAACAPLVQGDDQ